MTSLSPEPLELLAAHRDGTATLTIAGRLAYSNRRLLVDAISAALEQRPALVTLDCHALDASDSAGLGALVSCAKKCTDAGVRLLLVGLNDDLRAVLQETRLDTLFTWPAAALADREVSHG